MTAASPTRVRRRFKQQDCQESCAVRLLTVAYPTAIAENVTVAGYDLDYRLTSLQLKNGAAFVSNMGYAYGGHLVDPDCE
jgi:hypothetical protein